MTVHAGTPAECASMLRRLAAQPRQSIIWPYYHGRWPQSYTDAWSCAQTVLEPGQAEWFKAMAELPDAVVAVVIASGDWPRQTGLLMALAADRLEQAAAQP
jgi:hypothetical protein